MHIWLGNFESEKEFEKYLDQKKYLKAWAIYDNEPPTGNEKEDAEPDPALRCDFCKEVGLDTYDEDFMIMKYYKNSVDIKTLSDDIIVDENDLEKLWKHHKIGGFNAAIAYKDRELSTKDASNSTTVKYLDQITQISDETESEGSEVHYLWVGENKLDKKNILKQAEIDPNKVIRLNYYHIGKPGKLDDMLIIQIEDFNVAEKMILKVDKMNITMANSMLDLVVKGNLEIDSEKISAVLGMNYIGKFDS